MPTHCIGSQFITIEPPGTTCGNYLGSFLQREAGYVDNPSATSGCRYCPYRVGDEFFSTFSWDFSHRWRNFAILFAFIAGNLAVNYISMYRYRQKGQK
jgi:ATP-binding cassette subfamily G (WHITE) protein 2 (SNQ2)